MNSKKLVYLTELGILSAVIILMSFTPIGYLKIGVVEITFITIPVIIGSILMGPMAGGILGGIFGMTSFFQCFGISAFGMMLLEINPIGTFVLCLIPRILIGVFAGLIFKIFREKNILSYVISALSGALTNTILFVGGLILIFGNSDYIGGLIEAMGNGNVFLFFIAFVGVNGLIEAISCAVVGSTVSKALYKFHEKLHK